MQLHLFGDIVRGATGPAVSDLMNSKNKVARMTQQMQRQLSHAAACSLWYRHKYSSQVPPHLGSCELHVLKNSKSYHFGRLCLVNPAAFMHDLGQCTWQYSVRLERHPLQDQFCLIFFEMSHTILTGGFLGSLAKYLCQNTTTTDVQIGSALQRL